MTVARRVLVARCAVVVLLSGCSGGAERDVVAESATPAPSPSPSSSDPCAKYPPPFEATYLPRGFEKRLREGAGLFEGPGTAGYPRDGLVGYYAGPSAGVHLNFQTRPGPLPYEPGAPRPLRVLGRRGAIGVIEGGWSVEFALGRCDFRMDGYGITRAETVKVARGLRARD